MGNGGFSHKYFTKYPNEKRYKSDIYKQIGCECFDKIIVDWEYSSEADNNMARQLYPTITK